MTYEKVMCDDGTVPNRRLLKKGQFYSAANKQNGLESYHSIDMNTYSIAGGGYARY